MTSSQWRAQLSKLQPPCLVFTAKQSLNVKPGSLNQRLKPGISFFQFCSYVLLAAPQYSGILLPLQEETKEAVNGEATTEVRNSWRAAPRLAPACRQPAGEKNPSARMNHITNVPQKAPGTLGTFFRLDPSSLGKPKYYIPQLPLLSFFVINIYKSCIKRLHRKSSQEPHQVHKVSFKPRPHTWARQSPWYPESPGKSQTLPGCGLLPSTTLTQSPGQPQDQILWWGRWTQTLLSGLTPNSCQWLLPLIAQWRALVGKWSSSLWVSLSHN